MVSEDWRSRVLNRTLPEIRRRSTASYHPLVSDKWIAASALQKCIRRGKVDLALRAAARLNALDPVAPWRRLIIIAFEDVGAADPAALIETVAIVTSTAWRAKHDAGKILDWLVRRLAEAPKDRSADLAISALRYHENLASLRAIFCQASLDRRLELVTAPSASFIERAAAAWFASGLDFRYERLVGPGNLQGLSEAYLALGLDQELTEAMTIAARRTREAITILVPLILFEIECTGGGAISANAIPDSPVIDGLPLCALDEHTRGGKQAISRLVAEDARLQACLERFVPKPRWSRATQLAAFYVDGAPVSRKLDWAQSRFLEILGIEADLGRAQVPPDGAQQLIAAVHASLGRLNAIRQQIWAGLRNVQTRQPYSPQE
jgi:hypothetical protein